MYDQAIEYKTVKGHVIGYDGAGNIFVESIDGVIYKMDRFSAVRQCGNGIT